MSQELRGSRRVWVLLSKTLEKMFLKHKPPGQEGKNTAPPWGFGHNFWNAEVTQVAHEIINIFSLLFGEVFFLICH